MRLLEATLTAINTYLRLPNALRWFLEQGLCRFTPWHLVSEPSQGESAAKAFCQEDLKKRQVVVFAYRQDCDDFAGLEVVAGLISDRVICFHPSFGQNVAGWSIVDAEYEDVFEFVAQRVVPDMREWALTEDASCLTPQ